MNKLSQRLADIAKIDPAAIALEFKGRGFNWGKLAGIGSRVDRLLTDAGIGPGATIGVLLANRPGMVAVLYGLLIAERCIVFINPHYPAKRLSAEIHELGTSALIADRQEWTDKEIGEAVRATGALGICVDIDSGVSLMPGMEKPGPGPHRKVDPGIAMEILTSGTTGKPKRLQSKYSALADAILSSVRDDGPDGKPTLKRGATIVSAPLVHVSGIFSLLYPVCEGRPILLLEKFSVREWVEGIKRHRIRFTSLPPAAVLMVLDAKVPKEDLSSLLALRCGTAPLSPERQLEFERTYGVPILIQYSATEFLGGIAGWTLDMHKAFMPQKLGSIGRAQAGIKLRVVDPDTGEPLGPDRLGLLEVLPFKRFGEDAAWGRTTDLAKIDADGFVFLAGRADDVIIRGGFKIHLPTVAETIEQHEAVSEASVLGIPDARLGHVPVCALELRPGFESVTVADLEAFARANLAAYQVPVKFKVVPALPRTVSMKVDRPAVRALFEPA